jgi:thiol-disulfide isomerase/thioredoxin
LIPLSIAKHLCRGLLKGQYFGKAFERKGMRAGSVIPVKIFKPEFMWKNIVAVGILALMGVMAWYWLGRTELVFGDEMPEVTLSGKGYELDLVDLKGNYLLVYFWGSWCGPCRQKNPQLVDFYEGIKSDPEIPWSEDFEIVSIALETAGEAWIRIADQAGFSWPYQFVEPRFGNHPAYYGFGVNSIPSSFLVDREGRIVGVNPSLRNIPGMINRLEENT